MKAAFGAVEVDRAIDPSGKKIWHASLRVGNSMLFCSDTFEEMGGPRHPSKLWLYVEDVDAAFARAIAAGGKSVMPVADMFWGDRMGALLDPEGNTWTLASHVKDMTKEEMERAGAEFAKKSAQPT